MHLYNRSPHDRWKTLAVAYSPVLLLLAFVAYQDVVPASFVTKDAIAVAELPFYAGALSSLGIIFWCAAASICLFTYRCCRADRATAGTDKYLLYSGILTVVLMLDDLFLGHEQIFPDYLSIPEIAVIAAYLLVVPAHFFVFRKELSGSESYFLVLAGIFFATSIFIDVLPGKYLPSGWKPKTIIVEDGAKLLGIVSWFLYFSRLSMTRLRAA